MDIQDFTKKYRPHEIAKHQMEWVNFIEDSPQRYKMILGPRGHGKTEGLTENYLLWRVCHDPSLRILMISHKQQKASSFTRRLKIFLERKDIQKKFGIEKGTPWRINQLYLEGETYPVVDAIGATGGMTGGRYDVIWCDDLLHEDNCRTLNSRRKIEDWITGEVMFALDPSDKEMFVVIGTRKHVDDWYGKIIRNPQWDKRIDRAIKEDGTPLWPEKYSLEALNRRKMMTSPVKFAREMMNRVSPEEGTNFRRSWLKHYNNLPPADRLTYYMGVDPGLGMSNRASYFAIAVTAVDRKTNWSYVTELYQDRMSPNDQLEKVKAVFEKWEPRACLIESVMAYQFFFDQIKEEIPRVESVDYIHTPLRGTNTQKKIARIEALLGQEFKKGHIRLRNPEDDFYTKKLVEDEYIPFPDGEMDMLDALNLCVSQVSEPITGDNFPLALF